MELAIIIMFGDTDDSKSVMAKIKTIKDINRLKALKGRIISAESVPELMRDVEEG